MNSSFASKLVISSIIAANFTSMAFAKYPDIYPFKPMSVKEIYADVKKITEDEDFILNFNEIISKNLSRSKAAQQPWTSSYWPLVKGTIADAFEDSAVPYYADFIKTYKYQWKSTHRSYQKRKEKVHAKIDSLSEEQLAKLAPSEKYDLLLGDKSFDLTNRLMSYMKNYGSNNYFEGLSNIVLAPDKGSKNDSIAYAIDSMKWNNYKSIDEAFKKDPVLKSRLDVQIALSLVQKGLYPNVQAAMDEVLPIAQEEAKNYVLDEPIQDTIAAWEGICNGWSTAAGLIPRPRKAIDFLLPDGRKLKFFPDDIKGLISLYWFNSSIQETAKYNENGDLDNGGTILVGNRCNLRKVPKDNYGRKYDNKIDRYSKKLESRCVGVHPAKWHLGLINIMGEQQRSFIVERKVGQAVDNHPMTSYKMTYFNPHNGYEYETVEKNIEEISKKDQFYKYRNSKTKYIVGVKTTMTYGNYAKPSRKDTNNEEDDLLDSKTMLYDLELDSEYNIIGGQWRAVKHGKPKVITPRSTPQHKRANEENYNQPDFFWVVSKQWKKTGYFDDVKLEKWANVNTAPPRSYKSAALNGVDTENGKQFFHNYNYHHSLYYGNAVDCRVKNKLTGKSRQVYCEKIINKPQPLVNILNVLIDRSQ